MARKKKCRFGVNKNTGHCLKTKRSHTLSGSRRRRHKRR
jgi:hypothetical protein